MILYPQITQGKIYSVKDAMVKQAGKFNMTSCAIELTVTAKTEIQELPEEQSIPLEAADFIKIKEIAGIEQNRLIDFLAIVEEIQEPQSINLKTGETKTFQKVTFMDDTGSIVAAFWAADMEKICFKAGDIVALRSFLVKDYQGKSLNSTKSSTVGFELPSGQKYNDLLHLKSQGQTAPSHNLTESAETKDVKMNISCIKSLI